MLTRCCRISSSGSVVEMIEVHILDNGLSLCSCTAETLPRSVAVGVPATWPEGHTWISQAMAEGISHEGMLPRTAIHLCVDCLKVAGIEKEPAYCDVDPATSASIERSLFGAIKQERSKE